MSLNPNRVPRPRPFVAAVAGHSLVGAENYDLEITQAIHYVEEEDIETEVRARPSLLALEAEKTSVIYRIAPTTSDSGAALSTIEVGARDGASRRFEVTYTVSSDDAPTVTELKPVGAK